MDYPRRFTEGPGFGRQRLDVTYWRNCGNRLPGSQTASGEAGRRYRVRDETRDRNAELITALARTNERVLELEQENADLRSQLAGTQEQLSFADGA